MLQTKSPQSKPCIFQWHHGHITGTHESGLTNITAIVACQGEGTIYTAAFQPFTTCTRLQDDWWFTCVQEQEKYM